MTGVVWTAAIVALPLLLAIYWSVVYAIVVGIGGRDVSWLVERFDWVYAPFIFAIAGTFAILTADPVLDFDLISLLSIPLGAGLYGLTTVCWAWYTDAVPRRGGQSLVAVFPGLFTPFAEELLFRYGLAGFVDSIGAGGFVTVSAIVFGLHHAFQGPHEVVFKAAFGVILAAFFLWTGTVVVPALIHFGYNLAWVWYVTTDPA